MTSASWNCARNLRQAGTGGSAASSFLPSRASRARASVPLKPRRASVPSDASTSSNGRWYASA